MIQHVRQGSAPHLGREEKVGWVGQLPHLLLNDLSLHPKRRGCLRVKEARRQCGSTNERRMDLSFASRNLDVRDANVSVHAPILE
jgi:hypothetical protein